jgi:hypothetical protein
MTTIAGTGSRDFPRTIDLPNRGAAPTWAVALWLVASLPATALLAHEALVYLSDLGTAGSVRMAVAATSALAGVVAATQMNRFTAVAAALVTLSVLA